jgi:hypothetical protein
MFFNFFQTLIRSSLSISDKLLTKTLNLSEKFIQEAHQILLKMAILRENLKDDTAKKRKL